MRALWLLLAVLPLAGCIGDAGEDDTGAEPEPVMAAILHYNGCMEHMGVVAVPYDDINSGLPDGFTATPMDPAGQYAQGILIMLRCTLAGVESHEAFVMAAVEPPEMYRVEGVDFYMYNYGGYSDNAAALEQYAAWGFDMIEGTGTLTETDFGALRYGAGAFSDADGTIRLDTVLSNPDTAAAGEALGFYDSDDEIIALHVKWNEHAQWSGSSTVRFDGGIPTAGAYTGLGFQNFGADYNVTMQLHTFS